MAGAEGAVDRDYRLVIGGERGEGAGGTHDIVDPATEEVIAPAPRQDQDRPTPHRPRPDRAEIVLSPRGRP